MFGNARVIDHPFVAALARELWEVKEFKEFIKQNPDRFKRAAAVGLMLEFFCGPKRADGNFLPNMTEQRIDSLAGAPGFGRALGMSGLLSRETFPREGVQAFQLEQWFDPEQVQLLQALYEWWSQRPAAQPVEIPSPPGESEMIAKAVRKQGPKKTGNAEFDEFWLLWPEGARKVGKTQCQDKYALLMRDGVPHPEIMEGLNRWLKSAQWQQENGKFVPLPLTWLNQSRWEARPEPAAAGKEKEAEPALSDDEVRRRREEFHRKIAAKREGLNGTNGCANGED